MTVALVHSKQAASPTHPLNLHEISRNLTAKPPTILLGWTPPPNVQSYILYENGVKVSNSWKPSQSQANFKYVQGMKYGIEAMTRIALDELVAT